MTQAIVNEHKRVSDIPGYTVWDGMKSRCLNPKQINYPYYGGRGIAICDRWKYGENGKSGFLCFIEDMGERPSKKHTLDRIDNNGNYEPSNCRWTTRDKQSLNRRKRSLYRQGETPVGENKWAKINHNGGK